MRFILFICMNIWLPILAAISIAALKYFDVFFSWWVTVPVFAVFILAILGRFLISMPNAQ